MPRPATRRVGAVARSARPGRDPVGAGDDTAPRPRADPSLPDAGVAVRVLPPARLPSWHPIFAGTPRSGLQVQCCGDAHLVNFGGFASPDRRLIFSVNDFDETLPGPWEWDVKRLAASIEVAARTNEFDDATRVAHRHRGGRAYREAMREFALIRNLDLWYVRLDARVVFERWAQRLPGRQVARLRAAGREGAPSRQPGRVPQVRPAGRGGAVHREPATVDRPPRGPHARGPGRGDQGRGRGARP